MMVVFSEVPTGDESFNRSVELGNDARRWTIWNPTEDTSLRKCVNRSLRWLN